MGLPYLPLEFQWSEMGHIYCFYSEKNDKDFHFNLKLCILEADFHSAGEMISKERLVGQDCCKGRRKSA